MIKNKSTKSTQEIVPVKEKELMKIKKPSLKFKRWAELFFDRSKPEFYGNKTQCALEAYNTTNYNSASCIGYQNYRKLQFSVSLILELEGLGYGELIKIGASKMIAGSFSDWVKLMEIAGYFEPKNKPEIGVNINNTYNFANLQTDIIKSRRERGLEV